MNLTAENIQANNRANAEAALELARLQANMLEKLAALNSRTLRYGFDLWVSNARSLVETRSPQDALAMPGTLVSPWAEQAMAYSRDVYELTAQANAEASRIFERQVSRWNGQLASAFDGPAGGSLEPMFGATRSMLSALASGTHRAGDIAQANAEAVRDTPRVLTDEATANAALRNGKSQGGKEKYADRQGGVA